MAIGTEPVIDDNSSARVAALQLVAEPERSVEVYDKPSTEGVSEADLARVKPFTTEIFPSSTWVMVQTRRTYDAEYYDQLGTNIVEEGQINSIDVAWLAESELVAYLDDFNLFHHTTYSTANFTPDEFGLYRPLFAGHNRHMGVVKYNQEHFDDADATLIEAKLYPHIRFVDALEKQLQENAYSPLKLHEQAAAIVAYMAFKSKDGEEMSIAACARKLGMKQHRISCALRFMQLPEPVRDLVTEDRIVFSSAVALHKLSEYASENEMLGVAKQAEVNDWSTKRVVQETQNYIAYCNLPPKIVGLVQIPENEFDRDKALLLVPLLEFVEADDLVEIALCAITQKWDSARILDEVQRTRVRIINSNLNFDMALDDVEAIRKRAQQDALEREGKVFGKAAMEIAGVVRRHLTGLNGTGGVDVFRSSQLSVELDYLHTALGELEKSPDEIPELRVIAERLREQVEQLQLRSQGGGSHEELNLL